MNKSSVALAVTAAVVAQSHAGLVNAAFVEDSKATLALRNFHINQDTRNQAAPSIEEWGQGITLDYRSGFTEGTVGFDVDALGLYGVRLDSGGQVGKAGISRQPGSAFPLDGNGQAVDEFGHLGLTGKARMSRTVAQLGTLLPKMPVLTYGDGRLLPQTFEGAQVSSQEFDRLTLLGGLLEHSIERNSTNAQSLSIAGANSGATARASNTFYFGGADYAVSDSLLAQYYYGNLEDFYAQHFLGLLHTLKLPAGVLKTDVRYFYSDADGQNASAQGRAAGYRSAGYWETGDPHRYEVDSRLWSALLTYSMAGHALSAGYQQASGNSDFPYLNQAAGSTLYLITNGQLGKFASAGEKTWVAAYSYDFAKAGIDGLKAGMTYYRGTDIDAAAKDGREWERDTQVGYTLAQGVLKGAGLTWRHATWRGNDARDQDEHRLALSYTLPLR